MLHPSNYCSQVHKPIPCVPHKDIINKFILSLRRERLSKNSVLWYVNYTTRSGQRFQDIGIEKPLTEINQDDFDMLLIFLEDERGLTPGSAWSYKKLIKKFLRRAISSSASCSSGVGVGSRFDLLRSKGVRDQASCLNHISLLPGIYNPPHLQSSQSFVAGSSKISQRWGSRREQTRITLFFREEIACSAFSNGTPQPFY